MTDLQHDPASVARIYLQAWNETDPGARTARLLEHWAPDAAYVDPMATAGSRDEIGGLIGAVQARFAGFRFTLLGKPDGHGPFVRFSWSLGPPGAEPPIKGSDVVELRGGRIARVIGFLDQVPAS